MTIKKCDICGDTKQYLIQLRDDFKVNGIEEVCDSCANMLTLKYTEFKKKQEEAELLQRAEWIKDIKEKIKK